MYLIFFILIIYRYNVLELLWMTLFYIGQSILLLLIWYTQVVLYICNRDQQY